jgi:hypothetical protein
MAARFRSQLGLVTLATIVACTSLEPNRIDTSAAQSLRPPSASTLQEQLGDFQRVVAGGREVQSGLPATSKARDWVRGTIVYVPGSRSPNNPDVRSWSVNVDVLTFDSVSDADAYQTLACDALAMLLQRERDVALSRTGSGDVQECTTPLVQRRSDAGGFFLPMDSFMSAIVVRNGALVIRLQERREGSGNGTALQAALDDVARRLRAPGGPSD